MHLIGLALALANPAPTLAVDGLIIGSYQNKKWVVADDKLPTWKNVNFQSIGVGTAGKTYRVKAAVIMEMSGCPYLHFEDRFPEGALWSGAKPAFPRKAKSVASTANDQAAVKKMLAQKGVAVTPLKMGKVVSGDFDGDGKTDRIIQSRSVRKGEYDDKGDWTMVLYLQGGKAPVCLAFESMGESEGIGEATPVAVGDFDRDGTMDLVISVSYIEGGGGQIWSLKKTGPKLLMEKMA